MIFDETVYVPGDDDGGDDDLWNVTVDVADMGILVVEDDDFFVLYMEKLGNQGMWDDALVDSPYFDPELGRNEPIGSLLPSLLH